MDLDQLVDIGRWICAVLQARAVLEGQSGDHREERAEVKTPCIQVCTMDPQRGVCLGCCRTLDEIMRWSAMSDTERDR